MLEEEEEEVCSRPENCSRNVRHSSPVVDEQYCNEIPGATRLEQVSYRWFIGAERLGGAHLW